MIMIEAATQALQSLGGGPASAREIYDEIIRRELYKFGAKNPVSVLSSTMRERTEGCARLKGEALFISSGSGVYQLK